MYACKSSFPYSGLSRQQGEKPGFVIPLMRTRPPLTHGRNGTKEGRGESNPSLCTKL